MSEASYTKNASVDIESNVSDSGFEITDSKARIVFRDFLQQRRYLSGLSFSFSVFGSSLICLLTSDFKDILNIQNSNLMVKGGFIVICVLFGLTSLFLGIHCFRNRKRFSEDKFIDELHSTGKSTGRLQ